MKDKKMEDVTLIELENLMELLLPRLEGESKRIEREWTSAQIFACGKLLKQKGGKQNGFRTYL